MDQFMVDTFFHNLDKNINIYITPSFLEYFGYSGSLEDQKKAFLRTLKSHFNVDSDYWIYGNNEYKKFYDQVSENIKEIFGDEKLSNMDATQNSPSVDTEAIVIKSPEFPDPYDFIGVNGKILRNM